MFNIDIDIGPVVEKYNIMLAESKTLSNQILDALVEKYTTRWEIIVSAELNKTKAEYLRAIEVERPDDYTAIIKLTQRESRLPLMIEDGAGPFDIKEGLKNSSKRKTSIGGNWYIDVPFRFATGRAQGFSPAFTGGVAPSSVINRAKKAAGRGVPAAALPKKFREPSFRIGTSNKVNNQFVTTPTYHHKASIFSGIRRVDVQGRGKKKSGAYFTFRRVSDNSDPNSWIHRGFTARKFMDQTLTVLDIGSIVDYEILKFLNTI